MSVTAPHPDDSRGCGSAGLATSCKYNGAMAVVMPVIVAWTGGAGLAAAFDPSARVSGPSVRVYQMSR